MIADNHYSWYNNSFSGNGEKSIIDTEKNSQYVPNF